MRQCECIPCRSWLLQPHSPPNIIESPTANASNTKATTEADCTPLCSQSFRLRARLLLRLRLPSDARSSERACTVALRGPPGDAHTPHVPFRVGTSEYAFSPNTPSPATSLRREDARRAADTAAATHHSRCSRRSPRALSAPRLQSGAKASLSYGLWRVGLWRVGL